MITLVPDIPRICVQIVLEVHQIDLVKKQGWDWVVCSCCTDQVNRMAVDMAEATFLKVLAPSIKTDPWE